MHILHVVETLHVGGLERVVIDLVLQQAALRHECMVVCLFEKGSLSGELEDKGIPVSCCNKKNNLDLKAVRRLAETIRTFQPDIVHTHNMSCNYYAALALLKDRRIRLINTRHGIGEMPRKQRWLFGISLFRTAYLVGVCGQATELLRTRFPFFRHKMKTIPNGIVLDRHPPRSEQQHRQLTSSLGLPRESLLVTVVARLNPVKNHRMLIEAFAQTAEKVPLARLIIIGDGELRTGLEKLARDLGVEDKLLFLGDRRDVAELLAGMDLFVLPSTQEGHSISLIEACASSLPIIATNVGGNPEIVKDGINGLLTESNNVRALADKMEELLLDKEKRERFGQNGRTWAETEGSVQAMAQRYQNIYTK
jgi:glycosyltransferase involved in cell wall biosynthesis